MYSPVPVTRYVLGLANVTTWDEIEKKMGDIKSKTYVDKAKGKRKKSSKESESSRDSRSKEKKSSNTLKDASQSQHKHYGKSTHAEEPSHTIDDSGMQQDQEFHTSNNDEQPANKEVTKDDWYFTLGPKHQNFYGFAANMTSTKDVYSRKRIIVVTKLSILKKYDHGHLEEIELTNLTIDEWYALNMERYALNVVLRMFIRRIVIQRWVEDLQLGVESYQKKLNLTKPDTFRMEYLPKRKWSGLDKRRARVMIHDINKQLYERRLTRNLEKFVGGREYENDLKLLEQTI
ncbi:hypothetical protein Tco_0491824 [Tanacetum coccineum]